MADPVHGTMAPPVFKGSDTAPFLYFDVAPTFGAMAGAIEIELVARLLIPSVEQGAAAAAGATGKLN